MAEPARLCEESDCGRRLFARGMCTLHYSRWRKSGQATPCPVGGCARFVATAGYCNRHYLRLHRHGATEPMPVPRARKDGRGYLYVRDSGANRLLHRVVMEAHLQRPLARHESVHHKSGDRADNRITNLELWSSSQPSGQRIADKLAWARQIIADYDPQPEWIGACG